MSGIPQQMFVHGQVESGDDLIVAGSVRGGIWADQCLVTITADGTVDGDVVAREVVVAGAVRGSILASDVVEVFPGGSVTGQIRTLRLILREGGFVQASVEPQRVEAAFTVARHKRSAGHVA